MKEVFIQNKDIDRSKWDACIVRSQLPLFYGLSRVYDRLCGQQWAAVVWGDYEAVMPVSFGYKWGIIPYIYQPYFIQQSGVFSTVPLSDKMMRAGFSVLPMHFVRVHMHLNYGNCESVLNWENCRFRKSYQLDMRQDLAALRSVYSKDLLKNLRRFPTPETEVDFPIDTVIRVYQEAYAALNPGITSHHYARFAALLRDLKSQPHTDVLSLGVYHQGELMACGVFVVAFGYAHYCLGAPTEKGRRLGATHTLIDKALALLEGKIQCFDFEGSEIPNVARFYEKFAPMTSHYPVYKGRF